MKLLLEKTKDKETLK